jgi:anti-anti-sigma regulatory factor
MDKKTLSAMSREDGSIIISSGGDLTIANAALFVGCIWDALATSRQVVIEFDADVEVDVTTLQVLCSACKTAAATGRTLAHQGPGTKSLRRLSATAGAERLDRCRHNNDNPCIWFGGISG